MSNTYANPVARQWRTEAPPAEVIAFHRTLPNYAVTELISLPTIATELGVGHVFIKDESTRMNLAAFKVLGASWATARSLNDYLGTVDPILDLNELRTALASNAAPTLVAATDGNHGRAVAWMAKQLGLRCLIATPTGVSEQALDNIRAEGATVTPLDGTYDDAVDYAKQLTRDNAPAIHIQDMSWSGYETIPNWIIEGYTTLLAEVDDQLESAGAPAVDLVAMPVGVGALAHSVVAHYRSRAHTRPALLSVEPVTADCLLKSLQSGVMTSVDTTPTIMAGMNCGTPSSDSWPLHQAGIDSAIAIVDDVTRQAIYDLSDLGVDAGPCGAATLAGVREYLGDSDRRAALKLSKDSVIVLLSTEGRAANPLLFIE